MTQGVPPADRAHRHEVPPQDHRRWLAMLVAVLAGYGILTAAVILGSPLDRLDLFLYHLKLAPKGTEFYHPVTVFVYIGQGVPASTIAAVYAIRRSLSTWSWRPWVMFVISLVLLNATVGAVKNLTGRLGPRHTDVVHTVWAGGTIYPSGHAANAVVMYGLIAMIAPLAYRKIMTRIAVVLSVTVGLGTVALNTHWITDVFGGWLAGGLVLLLLRPITPPLTRLTARVDRRVRPVLVHWWTATPFRPLGVPRPAARRPATLARKIAPPPVAASARDATSIRGRDAADSRVGVADGARTALASAGTGRHRPDGPDSIPPRRVDARSRGFRHPAPSSPPVTSGSRSQGGDRRHQSTTQRP